ncbi:hypothetical protein L9F63_007925, partial [Diploptera punctata]
EAKVKLKGPLKMKIIQAGQRADVVRSVKKKPRNGRVSDASKKILAMSHIEGESCAANT